MNKNRRHEASPMRLGYLLLAILMSVSFTNAAIATQQRPQQILSSMRTSIKELQDSSISRNPSAKEQLEAISNAINELEHLLKLDSISVLHPAYQEALEMDAKLLESLIKRGDIESVLGKLKEVRSSLELKVKFAASSKGSALRLIQLLVKTVQKQQEVNGYEVWYVPRGWAGAPDKYRRFDDLSSPAIKELPAGNYLIWLQVAGRDVTERIPITLGEDDKSKRRVTLSVP
jgi:hypothetical protein